MGLPASDGQSGVQAGRDAGFVVVVVVVAGDRSEPVAANCEHDESVSVSVSAEPVAGSFVTAAVCRARCRRATTRDVRRQEGARAGYRPVEVASEASGLRLGRHDRVVREDVVDLVGDGGVVVGGWLPETTLGVDHVMTIRLSSPAAAPPALPAHVLEAWAFVWPFTYTCAAVNMSRGRVPCTSSMSRCLREPRRRAAGRPQPDDDRGSVIGPDDQRRGPRSR